MFLHPSSQGDYPPNPSIPGRGKPALLLMNNNRRSSLDCQFLSPSSLEVLLVRHLASAPTTYTSSSTLASPQWAMERGFVLREQFKCRAMEKAARTHDQQIYILICKILPPVQDTTECRTALMNTGRHIEVLRGTTPGFLSLLHLTNMNATQKFNIIPHLQYFSVSLNFPASHQHCFLL